MLQESDLARRLGWSVPAVPGSTAQAEPRRAEGRLKILIVDLNNFASFPTLAVGLLIGALREHGHRVRLVSPLAHGVPATAREGRETRLDHLARRLHLSTHPAAERLRELARGLRTWHRERPHPVVLREFRAALEGEWDAVLLSAYLKHYETVGQMGRIAGRRGVPVLVGGPMFSIPETAAEWARLPGISAVVGAEADLSIGTLVTALCRGRSLDGLPGVATAAGARMRAAPPLRRLDDAPVADFTDFPWARYPVKIVPLMTGRGCQWDRCLFCSDVLSVSGRTFRTRSVENVLLEMKEQSHRHATRNFLFLDLKLNSFPGMIRGIAEQAQRYVPGAEWVGTVHVDLRRDNGLSRQDLGAAVAGGMRRVSFGLESGSQRLLDLMQKGSSVEANEDFIRNAHEAGLSVRCTMFKGFPGETADDMDKTAAFLERHVPYLDRVRFNDFSLHAGTPVARALAAGTLPAGGITVGRMLDRRAKAEYRAAGFSGRAYRRAKARALRAVFEINRRALRPRAAQFDGLM